MDVKNLIPVSTEQIMGFRNNGSLVFILDELQNAEVTQNQDVQDVTGKLGRRIGTIKRNKTASVTATNGIVVGGLMEAQFGTEFESGTHAITWTDTLKVDSDHTVTLSFAPTGAEGAEIDAIRVRNSDGTLGKEYKQAAAKVDSAVPADSFVYTAEGKKVEFPAAVQEGTEIVAIYGRNVESVSIADDSDTYSEKLHIVVDQLAEDKCGNVYRVQWDFPLADVSGEFTYTVGDSQAVHSFTANALAGGCGQGNQFFTYTVFGAEAEDVTA